MNKNFKFQLNLFWQLLKKDLLIFKSSYFSQVIDVTIWVVCMIVATAYVYPKMGMMQSYGAFFAFAMIISTVFWSIWDVSTAFLADLEGNRAIGYELSLPIPSYLILVNKAIFYALRAMSYSWIVLLLCKLLMWNQMDLMQVNWPKLILIYISMSVFVAFFSLFTISLINGMDKIGIVSMRILFPLWFLGGSQFSWKFLFSVFPNIAYLTFLNPLLYGMEGVHAACLNPNDYLSFWFCIGMLSFFTIVFGLIGIKRLRKRLDFI